MPRFGALFMVAAMAGCRPDLGPIDSLVTSTRILAVRATPPEARPGTSASYEALAARPAAHDQEAPMLWRWCTAPKPIGENNTVSTSCLDASSLLPAGMGSAITAATPAQACALFGPDTPPGGFRPRDADTTGGYYTPLRVDVDGADPAFHRARVLCNLAEAPTDVAAQYARDYAPNTNPHLLPISARIDGTIISLDAVPSGANVRVTASWPAEDAESFVYFDRATQTLVPRRESLRVAWYATVGEFETQSTGRSEDDSASETENAWIAPHSAGEARLWMVLRDSRGGSDFAAYTVRVAP